MAWICLALVLGAHVWAAREYEVKAAFLYNFTKFVEWPAASFATPASPILVGIVGEDPFGETLDQTLRGETARGRAFEVRRFRAEDDFTGCHVLFVSRSESRQLETILRRVEGRAVLTVSEEAEFARRGGMIELVVLEQCVRFEINLSALEKAGLKASSKLLAVACAVRR